MQIIFSDVDFRSFYHLGCIHWNVSAIDYVAKYDFVTIGISKNVFLTSIGSSNICLQL